MMKKKLLIFPIGLIFGVPVYGQTGAVGVNTSSPKATLDVVASPTNQLLTDGLIAPRLTGNELKNKDNLYNTDQKGTIIYATEATNPTSAKTVNVTSEGYYYFDGIVWVKFKNDPVDYVEPWNLAKTSSPATSNSQNIYQMGRVGINTDDPLAQLHIHQVRSTEAPDEELLYDGYYTTYGRTELNHQGLTSSKSYRGANFGLIIPANNNSTYNNHLIGGRIGIELLGDSKHSGTHAVTSLYNFTRLSGNTEFSGSLGAGLRNAIQFRDNVKMNTVFSGIDNTLQWNNNIDANELYLNRSISALSGSGKISKLFINYANSSGSITPVTELYANYVDTGFNTSNSLKKYAFYNASTLPIFTTNAFRGGTLHTSEANDVNQMGIRSFSYGLTNRIPTESGFAFGNNNVTSSSYTYFYGNGNTIISDNAAHAFIKGVNNKILDGTDAKYTTIFGVSNEIGGANSAYTLISGSSNTVDSSTRSFITGANNNASNDIGAFIMGVDNTIENGVNSPAQKTYNAFAFGSGNTTSGSSAFTLGANNHANWQRSFAIGVDNITSALNSAAIGTGLRTGSSFEIALGRYNAITTGNPTSTTTMTDPILQVGIGTSDTDRKNAMTIYKSGTIQIANLPVYADDAEADTDTNLPSGALYKLSTGRGVYQKP